MNGKDFCADLNASLKEQALRILPSNCGLVEGREEEKQNFVIGGIV